MTNTKRDELIHELIASYILYMEVTDVRTEKYLAIDAKIDELEKRWEIDLETEMNEEFYKKYIWINTDKESAELRVIRNKMLDIFKDITWQITLSPMQTFKAIEWIKKICEWALKK